MNGSFWPLVFFTLLSQLSMGIILAGFIVFLFVRNSGQVLNDEIRQAVVLTAFIAMAAALALAFLHLARPLHSVYAIGNLGTSSLSREILLVCACLALLFMTWMAARMATPFKVSLGYFYLPSMIMGILLVGAMARLYMIPTVPPWNSPWTMVKFYNSGLLLGSGALLVLLLFLHDRGGEMVKNNPAVTVLFFLLILGFLVHIGVIIFDTEITSDIQAGFLVPVIARGWMWGRLVVLALGLVTLLWWYIGFISEKGQNEWACLAVSFILVAEIIARVIFYSSYYRVGV